MTSGEYAKGLGRAVIGSSLFALPLFMTMEMWQLGVTMDRLRLGALLVVTFPMLVALSHFAGFERTFSLLDDTLDACAAFAVAVTSSSVILLLFGVLAPGQPVEEVVGKIAVVSFPGAIGALLADKQLGSSEPSGPADDRSYAARLFLMTMGGMFVALNVSPTDEIILIAFQVSPWQAMLLAVASLAILHALLFWVDFPGREGRHGGQGFWSILLRYSLVGYALCLLSSFFLLWTFGRTDGVSISELAEFVVVLAFPAALGAGLAQMVVGENRG